MHLKDFFPSSLVISLFISILSHAFPKYVCGIDFRYATCNSSAECGRLGKIHYPFWVNGSQPRYCGHPWFCLYCHKDEAPMWISSEPFHVIDMDNRTQTLKIARIYEPSTGNFFCPIFNASIKSTSFSYSSDVEFITFLHNCPPIEVLSSYEYPCVVLNKTQIQSYFVANTSLANRFRSRCGYSVLLPVLGSAVEGLMNGSLNVEKALSKGFEVKWTANEKQCEGCMESGGRCGYDLNLNTPSCFCRDQPYPESCSQDFSYPDCKSLFECGRLRDIGYPFWGKGRPSYCGHPKFELHCERGEPTIEIKSQKYHVLDIHHETQILKIARFLDLFDGNIVCPESNTTMDWVKLVIFCTNAHLEKEIDVDQNIEEFVKNYGSQAPKRYSYSNVKKMTNSFKDKLGQGGYGGVYKGKLGDGHLVAVKVLNTSKGNGDEFINEVASISRTSHVNIVRLLGFCFEGGKKALIYEFMRNGSLENFLCSEKPLKADKHLGWEKLYQIAVGIARGLEYLHCGCRTKILHFDVKPHNILLDQDFSPKISDFGLAKLCPPKESILSMSNFGQVSHKSDVYSYGMMVLEMTYFPHWIYKHLEQQEDPGLEGIENKEENEITRKMIVVGLWCIQTNPSHRPCMSKMIEMLEGSIEALQIPPKPFLSSPPRFPIDSSSFKSTLSQ
ncbi:hypothetical protein AAG906_014075 [Vitis piasezkii]